jgi:superoxide reductase
MELDLFGQINRAKDMSNLTDLEKKHTPVIDAPDKVNAGEPFEVTVEVGKLLKHPNEMGHHIQWVNLFSNDLLIVAANFTPVSAEPKASFVVILQKSTTLRAVERCNLHGEWEYTKKIEVS